MDCGARNLGFRAPMRAIRLRPQVPLTSRPRASSPPITTLSGAAAVRLQQGQMPRAGVSIHARPERAKCRRRTMGRFMAGVMVVVCAAHAVAAQDAGRTDGWVVMGIDEYRALRARSFPSAPDPAPPPLDAAPTRVDYDLRV